LEKKFLFLLLPSSSSPPSPGLDAAETDLIVRERNGGETTGWTGVRIQSLSIFLGDWVVVKLQAKAKCKEKYFGQLIG
jgi:hypothetical protein